MMLTTGRMMQQPPSHQRCRWNTQTRVLPALWLGTCLFLLCTGEHSQAQEASVSQSGAKAGSKAITGSVRSQLSTAPAPTAEQIEHARDFALKHHPELGELLGSLEKYDEPSFVEAVHELLKTIDRIEKLSEKNAERGRVELEDWKLTSRIRLLAARLAMADALPAESSASTNPSSKTIKQEIRQLLIERAELRKSTLTAERQRLQDRLEKVNRQLNELSERERQNIERELDRLEANASLAKSRQKAVQSQKSSQEAKPRNKSNSPDTKSSKAGSVTQPADQPAGGKQKP